MFKSPVIQEAAIIEGFWRSKCKFCDQIFRNRCWQISRRLDHRNTSQHNTNTQETFVVVRSCGTNVFWTKNLFEVDSGLRNTPNSELLSAVRELILLVVVQTVLQRQSQSVSPNTQSVPSQSSRYKQSNFQ